MTDNRATEMPPLEHDEYHSSLEVDDTSGWRVFIVPVMAVLFFIGVILFIVLYQGDSEPDPRIAGRLKPPPTAESYAEPTVAPVTAPATQPTAASTTETGQASQPSG